MGDPTGGERLGILFVHGMGDHKAGETIRKFGEPLIDWVSRWQSRDMPLHTTPSAIPTAMLSEAAITESTDDPAGTILPSVREIPSTRLFRVVCPDDTLVPPHAEIAIGPLEITNEGAGHPPVTWVMAEAWWAQDFAPPKFSAVAKWGLGLAPRTIISYVETSGFKGSTRLLWLQYLAALVAVVAFQTIMIVLLAFGAIPKLRNFISGVVLKLTGAFGDPLVMLSQPLSAAAIRTSVTQSLDWLRHEQHCTSVAVIAHSQGTAIAYEVLQRDSSKVDLFVTFGAVLKKLKLATDVQMDERRLSLGIVLASTGVISLAVAAIVIAIANANARFASGFGSQVASWYVVSRLMLVLGLLVCVSRLALWELGGRRVIRWLAPLGGTIALAGTVVLAGIGANLTPFASELDPGIPVSRFRDAPVGALAGTGFLAVTLVLIIMREWRWQPDRRSPWMSRPVIQTVMLVGMLLTALGTPGYVPADDWLPFWLVAAGVFCLSAIPVPIGDVPTNVTLTLSFPRRRRQAESPLTWVDFWAKGDPFPDLGLPESTANGRIDVPNLTSTRISNQDSVINDHSIYSENYEEFVGPVAQRLARMTGWHLFSEPGADTILTRAKRARRERLDALGRVWWVAIAAALVTWFNLGRDGLAAIGVVLVPLRDGLGGLLDLPLAGFADTIKRLLPDHRLGLIVVGAVVTLWYRLAIFQAWRHWDKADVRSMFQRHIASSRSYPRWSRLTLVAATTTLTIAAIYAHRVVDGITSQLGADEGEFASSSALFVGGIQDLVDSVVVTLGRPESAIAWPAWLVETASWLPIAMIALLWLSSTALILHADIREGNEQGRE